MLGEGTISSDTDMADFQVRGKTNSCAKKAFASETFIGKHTDFQIFCRIEFRDNLREIRKKKTVLLMPVLSCPSTEYPAKLLHISISIMMIIKNVPAKESNIFYFKNLNMFEGRFVSEATSDYVAFGLVYYSMTKTEIMFRTSGLN